MGCVSRCRIDVSRWKRAITSGVGATADVMGGLESRGLVPVIHEVIDRGTTPFLGICVGMQVLLDRSEEHETHPCLGVVPGAVLDAEELEKKRRLIAAANGLAKGEQPPGIDVAHQRVRSASVILPKGVPFAEAAEDALMPEPGSAHATV